jgi:hypothetical protein
LDKGVTCRFLFCLSLRNDLAEAKKYNWSKLWVDFNLN